MRMMAPDSAWRLAWVDVDGKKLLIARALRSFGYGHLAIILALYLEQIGLDVVQVGVVLTAAVAGSAAMTVVRNGRARGPRADRCSQQDRMA